MSRASGRAWGSALQQFGNIMLQQSMQRRQEEQAQKRLDEQRLHEVSVYKRNRKDRLADIADKRKYDAGLVAAKDQATYLEDPLMTPNQMYDMAPGSENFGMPTGGGGLEMQGIQQGIAMGDFPHRSEYLEASASDRGDANKLSADLAKLAEERGHKAGLLKDKLAREATQRDEAESNLIPFDLGPKYGNRTVKISPEDEAMNIWRFHRAADPEEEKQLSDTAIDKIVGGLFASDRQVRGLGGATKWVPQPSTGVSMRENEAMGPEGMSALAGLAQQILYGGGYGVGKKTPQDAADLAISMFDVPNEYSFLEDVLPDEYDWFDQDTKLDDKGTPDTADDVFLNEGHFGTDEVPVGVVAKAILDKAGKGSKGEKSVTYKAALEILEGTGMDMTGYNAKIDESGKSGFKIGEIYDGGDGSSWIFMGLNQNGEQIWEPVVE